MIKGFIYALSACLLWGTIFIAPQFLPEFSLMEVALGRYLSFGLFSLCLIFFTKMPRYPFAYWKLAVIYGLVAGVLYYVGVVAGVRYASAPITVLIVGLCPVFAAIYGNWGTKEMNFRGLILSCLIMTFGVVLVNVLEIDWSFRNSSFREYLLGLLGAITGLVTWGWYAVQNARFLKKNPDLPRGHWATMMGSTTLIWVVLFGTIFSCNDIIDIHKFTTLSWTTTKYFAVTAFLGIVCAWVGSYLWNKASTILPISLMGPMIIFETIFALFFVFLQEMRTPSLLEFSGILAMLIGIYLCIAEQRKGMLRT